MTSRRFEADPNQGALLLPPTTQQVELPNPVILQPTPEHIDPPIGLHTPVIEGWTVLNDVIHRIARARSNQGFLKLPESSRPVKDFAEKVETSKGESVGPAEALDMVAATVDSYHPHEGPRRLTHYERAQIRLNDYGKKQVKRARQYNDKHHLVDDGIVASIQPVPVGTVEHQFFYANSPSEKRRQANRRATIARFVSKHSQ